MHLALEMMVKMMERYLEMGGGEVGEERGGNDGEGV